jgi:hypothetical protein
VDIEIQAREIMYHKANLNRILAYHCNQPVTKVDEDTDRDRCARASLAQSVAHVYPICHLRYTSLVSFSDIQQREGRFSEVWRHRGESCVRGSNC